MNLSISSLRLYYFTKNSLISHSPYSGTSNIKFRKISANNFFSHFFQTQNPRLNSNFFRCKFNKFLGNAIYLDSDRFYEMRFHQSEQFSSNSTASFKLCVFTNCFNTESKGRGGAVLYMNNDGRLIFNNCGFDNCTADSGGAFSAKCKIYTILSTCINHCHAIDKFMTFRIMGNIYKAVDLELSAIRQVTMFNNGPPRVLQQKTFCYISDITVFIEHFNVTNTWKMYKAGVLRFQQRALITRINIHYGNFKENDGPGLLLISHPLATKSEDAPKIESTNFIANNPGEMSLIYINDTKCLIRNCVFMKHTQPEMSYLTLSEGSHLTLHTCYVDVSLKQFKGFIQGRFKNHSSVFEVNDPIPREINAINIDSCFEFAITATFSPSATRFRKDKDEINTQKILFSPTLQFTPSRRLYPKNIYAQQLTLLIVAIFGVPTFYLLFIMKQRQIQGRPRKTKRRAQK